MYVPYMSHVPHVSLKPKQLLCRVGTLCFPRPALCIVSFLVSISPPKYFFPLSPPPPTLTLYGDKCLSNRSSDIPGTKSITLSLKKKTLSLYLSLSFCLQLIDDPMIHGCMRRFFFWSSELRLLSLFSRTQH